MNPVKKEEDISSEFVAVKQEMDYSFDLTDYKFDVKSDTYHENHANMDISFDVSNHGSLKVEQNFDNAKMMNASDDDMSVKQEEWKPDPYLDDDEHNDTQMRSASIASSSTDVEEDGLQVKEEPLIKPTITIPKRPIAEFFEKSGRDYFYKCHLCTALHTTLISLLDHHKNAHKYTYVSKTYKHLSLEPDIRDPNLYCRVCETKYPTTVLFNKHIRTIHFIINKLARKLDTITPIRAIKREKEGVVPDGDDPNNYCRSCSKTYLDRKRYLSHLWKFHKMKCHRIRRNDALPDLNDPNQYCKTCNRTLASRYTYFQHCKKIHKMEIPSGPPPNIHDVNFHCKPCDIRFDDQPSYWNHCRDVHQTQIEKTLKATCEICFKSYSTEQTLAKHKRFLHKGVVYENLPGRPDINDPNFYCSPCDKKFDSKEALKMHLLMTHAIKKAPKPIEMKIQCKPCKEHFVTRPLYHEHLQAKHRVVLSLKDAQDSDFLPDPEDPDFYCRTCGKIKESLERFRTHCKNIHHMKLIPLASAKKAAKAAEPPKLKPLSEFDCPICRKKMNSKRKHLFHMRIVHKVKRTKHEQRFPNPDLEININSPDFECAKCGRYYEDESAFALHLGVVHSISLKERLAQQNESRETSHEPSDEDEDDNLGDVLNMIGNIEEESQNPMDTDHESHGAIEQTTSTANANVEIDVNSPELYCSKCDKHLVTKNFFNYHLTTIHVDEMDRLFP